MLFTSSLFVSFLIFCILLLAAQGLVISFYRFFLAKSSASEKFEVQEANSINFEKSLDLAVRSSSDLLHFSSLNFMLLLMSLAFYVTLNGSFIFLLIFVAFSDYCLGIGINMFKKHIFRKILLFTSVLIDLGLLFFYKYTYLFIDICLKIGNKMLYYLSEWKPANESSAGNDSGDFFSGISTYLESTSSAAIPSWISEIVLPLGISFFVFQSMSYTIDVYRSVLRPEKSFFRYLLYISFFPQLVAGPIVKAKEFLPQLWRRISWADVPLVSAFGWIFLGIFKKAILADRISPISDFIYQYPNDVSSAFTWLGVFAYSLQIYLDFSGYTDIAIGLALFFGFRLSKNFDMPYFSATITDFWNRWHISLSSWLRDYLYIPLGGNRISEWITYRNLFIVMLLGGIWHGASWNFLLWGCIHGILLGLERYFQWNKRVTCFPVLVRVLLSLLVFFIVSFVWIFFRSQDFGTTQIIISNLLDNKLGISIPYTMKMDLLWVSVICLIGHILGTMKKHPSYWMDKKFSYKYSFAAAVIMIVFVLMSADTKPFIYFVF